MDDYGMNGRETREQESTLNIDDLLQIGWRRKWFIAVPVILSTIIALVLCYTLPRVYEASTTIIVDPEIVSDDYMKSLLVTQPNEYMNILGATINSRTSLEKVINELGLFPDLVGSVPMERLVENMRENISLSIENPQGSARGGLSYFSLSYQGEDPEIVASVVNRVVSLFIEEHYKSMGAQAGKTSEYLTQEIERARSELQTLEGALIAFKEENQLNLPEQRESNLRILENLMTRAQTVADNLNTAKNRKIILMQQPIPSEGIPSSNGNGESGSALASPIQQRFNEATRRLYALREKYTDAHPDVIRTKEEIAKLKAALEGGSAGDIADDSIPLTLSPENNQELVSLNMEIDYLTREDQRIAKMIKDYESRIEKSHQIEPKLARLTDNVENAKQTYEQLLKDKNVLTNSSMLGQEYRQEQFKVLDPAIPPEIPFKPNKRKVLLIGFVLGLMAGLGICFLMETMDKSFSRISDAENYLQVPVLMSIPTMDFSKTADR